jgi:predicted CxxxxCH...CXXCH cytochrome family protein
MTKILARSSAALLVLSAPACTRERQSSEPQACFAYELEIQPLVDAACLECHGPSLAEGGYRVTTLADVLERDTSGKARVVAGDTDSPFLERARGAAGHPVASAKSLRVFERWIGSCLASSVRTDLVHPHGFVDPAAQTFHGKSLRESGWDFTSCETCHGDVNDSSGGPVGRSCLTCHAEGPTSCNTCHGTTAAHAAPPPALDDALERSSRGVGAHAVHVTGGPTLGKPVLCEDCHQVPETWTDPGHVFDQDGNIDPLPAEVVLGEAAGRDLSGFTGRRPGPPSYDPATGTCANVYCHGGEMIGDPDTPAPVWTASTDGPACDTCHGMPPTQTHPTGLGLTDCVRCHEQVVNDTVVDQTLGIVEANLHIDAQLSLGDGSEQCWACHGSSGNPAPPPGMHGEQSTSELAVGAHSAHVMAGTFRGPIECSECHVEPRGNTYLAAVAAPGHIDSWLPAEVFSEAPAFHGLASADHAMPVYERATGTCSNTYCHGGGEYLLADETPDIVRSLSWTDVGSGTVTCGSCHGLPPSVETGHRQRYRGVQINETQCSLCHGATIDDQGNLIVPANGVSYHIDG